MKPLFRSFFMFIRQISKDSMLYAVCIAPLLAAFFFKFGVPFVEEKLCALLKLPSVISGYYLMIDLFLAVLTPYMLSFASSMVILTEYDENMTGYLAVTPVGKGGYIISRLVIPAALSFVVSAILLLVFALTHLTFLNILLVSLLGSILSVAVSLLLVSLSHNRVEGMALAKLSGILLLGLPVPFFLFNGVQFVFTPLPSFWIGKMVRDDNLLLMLPALVTSALWIAFLSDKFKKKIS